MLAASHSTISIDARLRSLQCCELGRVVKETRTNGMNVLIFNQ